MPAILSLKKQLRGIRSTQKLTKAMKTVSTVKFSRLNEIYGRYLSYGDQCRKIFERFGALFSEAVFQADPDAPAAVVVMASNKGLCGNFNADLLNFAKEYLAGLEAPYLVACGRKAVSCFRGSSLPPAKEYVLNDIPTYGESCVLLDDLLAWRRDGKVSDVYVVYPEYVNMMTQTPCVRDLFKAQEAAETDMALLVPDRNTVIETTVMTALRAMFYEIVLKSALGAQAATLMTMRSAYDTATEYCARLEGQINRRRQNSVTADVIETSADVKETSEDAFGGTLERK